MADTVSVDCGSCGKRFRVRQDQLNRKIQCPHCRAETTVKGPSSAQAAAAEMFGSSSPHGLHAAGREKPLTSADIFGPEPLPQVHKSQTLAAQAGRQPAAHGVGAHGAGAHGAAAHGRQGADSQYQPPPRPRSGNTVMFIILGAGAGVIILALIIIGVTAHVRSSGPVVPERTATSGPVVPVKAFQPAAMTPEEKQKLLAKPSETPAGTDTTSAVVEATSERPSPVAATDTSASAPIPMKGVTHVVDDVGVSVELVQGGFFSETVTFVSGHVNNGTGKPIRVLKVTVPMLDRDTKAPKGEAVGLVLNLGPGQTAPYIAEWTHEEGVMAVKGEPTCQIDPPGSVQGLPPMQADGPVPFPDPNTISASGKIRLEVTNHGVLEVSEVELIGVLLGKDGKIVGATKGTAKGKFVPGKKVSVTLNWTQCSGTKVDSAEVWAQAVH